jgi:hypothetical protein
VTDFPCCDPAEPVPLDPRVDLEAAQKMVDRYKNIIENGWITKFDDAMVHSMAALVPALVAELGAARARTDDLRLWIQEMRAVCQQEGSRLARHFLSELDALGAAVLGGEPE